MNHREARSIVTVEMGGLLGSRLTFPAVQLATAIGHGETHYGSTWKPPMKDSHNWGALQTGSGWRGPSALYGDSYTVKGKTTPYQARYRCYIDDAAGARDMCRLLVSGFDGRALPFLLAGDVEGFSDALRCHRKEDDGDDRRGYYDGFGPSPEKREENHRAMVWRGIIAAEQEIAANGSRGRLPDGKGGELPVPPTLRPDVLNPTWTPLLREALGLPREGRHPLVELAKYQGDHRATPDGVAGPTTWGHLLADFGPALLAPLSGAVQ